MSDTPYFKREVVNEISDAWNDAGRVIDRDADGFRAGTLLYAGYDAKRVHPNEAFNVKLRFLHRPEGWNGQVFATPEGVAIKVDVYPTIDPALVCVENLQRE